MFLKHVLFLLIGPWSLETEPTEIEIAILGSTHLKYESKETNLGSIPDIIKNLQNWEPDHLAVEWLHPSIDQTKIWNYKGGGTDLNELAKSWGMSLESAKSEQTLKPPKDGTDAEQAEQRIAMGKQYYLQGKSLTAMYNWWLAEKLGANLGDLEKFMKPIRGHELAVLGFPIAQAMNLEHITPFDWQGPTDLWGDGMDFIEQETLMVVIEKKFNLKPDDPGYQAAVKTVRDDLKSAKTLADLESYAHIPEFINYASLSLGESKSLSKDMDSFLEDYPGGLFFALQDPAYYKMEQSWYYDILPRANVKNGGRRLVKRYEHRNEEMFRFLERDIERQKSRKVLVIVGAGHKAFLETIARREGYKIVSTLDLLKRS